MPVTSTSVADAETIRDTATEVLQHPDYKLESTESFRRVVEWLLSFLRPILEFFDRLYKISPFLFFLLVAALFLILGALIFHIGYSLRNAMQRRRIVAAYEEASDTGDQFPETWARRAREAFAADDYLLAIRFILHASLLRLESARKARLRRAATNREYLRRYKDTAVSDPLAQLVEITDSRWYGGVACSRQDVETCFQADQQIQQLLRKGGGGVHNP